MQTIDGVVGRFKALTPQQLLIRQLHQQKGKSLSNGNRSGRHMVTNTLGLGLFVPPCQELGCSFESPDVALRFYSPQIIGLLPPLKENCPNIAKLLCASTKLTKPKKWRK